MAYLMIHFTNYSFKQCKKNEKSLGQLAVVNSDMHLEKQHRNLTAACAMLVFRMQSTDN